MKSGLSSRALEVLNDPALLEIRNNWVDRLSRVFAGERLDQPLRINGIFAAPQESMDEPETWTRAALEQLAQAADALRDTHVFRPLCVHPRPYGVRFPDKVLGAEVYPDRDNPLWHTRRLEHPVGELAAPDWEADPTWKQAKELARAFLACKVSLPFFGAPALSSALNCAMNLYGQELFIAMCMEPQKARKDLAVIHDLLVSMHRFYIRTIPSAQLQIGAAGLRTKPPGFGHLDGCATQLVSGDMYRELIGPLDDGLLSLYPKGGMIHICGSHTQHIPVWKAMRSLRALQVNDRASEDLEAYLAGLRDDQVIYLQPTATMTVERAWKISGGRRLIVMDIG